MAQNEGASIHRLADYQQKPSVSAAPSDLKSGSGGGTSGGMDGWQTSVEARLGEIKTDIRDMRAGIGSLNANTATLTERIAHLPSKGFVVTTTLIVLTAVTALIAFQGQIQAFLKIPH